jgi:recombination DNA repair RAD52 pathway protein
MTPLSSTVPPPSTEPSPEREKLIARLKAAVVGPSYVSRKYGAGIRQQIRYLEGLKVTAS